METTLNKDSTAVVSEVIEENVYRTQPKIAGSWIRFLARTLDIYALVAFIGFFGGHILSIYLDGFSAWLLRPGSDQIFGIACLPVALLIDALIYKFFKNTFSKSILGLKIVDSNGVKITADDYLGRNFSLWKSGYAYGIPLLNLFTLAEQYIRVRKAGQATYDAKHNYRVVIEKTSIFRKAGFAVAFVVTFAALLILTAAAQRAPAHIQSKSFDWVNSETHNQISVGAGWSVSENFNSGVQEATFTNDKDDVAIYITHENTNKDIHEYISLMRNNTINQFMPNDDGKFYEYQNNPFWVATGTMIKDRHYGYACSINIVKGKAWRILTIYPISQPASQDAINLQKKIILSTLN